MQLNFQDVTLEEAPRYIAHWNMCAQRTSDYCFPIIWSLASDFGTEIAYDESTDLYWLHQTKVGEADLAPVGNWQRDDWPAILRERYKDEITFYLVPEQLAQIWLSEFNGVAEIEVEENRGAWEYLYDIRALASLAGNKYMKKRNRVNHFRKNYDYTYTPLTDDFIDEVADFQSTWCADNGASIGLVAEDHGIHRILKNWHHIPNLCGGVIHINDRIIAYTVGELAGNMLIVHYEKALTEYSAAYQVINKEFLAHIVEEHPELEIVNREEDMDEPGLRAAKMSYMPTGFLKECKVKIKFK